jgi:hypothetical protein
VTNQGSSTDDKDQIELDLDDHSHMITPEQRLSFAMARQ